jgi:hypothetical protein
MLLMDNACPRSDFQTSVEPLDKEVVIQTSTPFPDDTSDMSFASPDPRPSIQVNS